MSLREEKKKKKEEFGSGSRAEAGVGACRR